MARCLAAFSGTSGSRVGGAIPPAMMRKECADRKEIELIHAFWIKVEKFDGFFFRI